VNQEKEFHTLAQALIFRGKVSLHLVIQQNLLPFLNVEMLRSEIKSKGGF